MKNIICICIFTLFGLTSFAQTRYTALPSEIISKNKYLFYLHGRIIEEEGIRAVSKKCGAYEYYAILDTLKNYGFTVISEARPKNTNINLYAKKTAAQIDTLLKAGVAPEYICSRRVEGRIHYFIYFYRNKKRYSKLRTYGHV
ncbi:MAG: hypothetical protein H7282_01130 [Cytophagaceae bacterium]|nr:hypothetical protein [Cytophagaceae bacterium]